MCRQREEEMQSIELQLDTVFFEDGLCVGPDESGLFESVTKDFAQQRDTARQVVELLRAGASPGQVFDLIRPLGRREPLGREPGGNRLRFMFAYAAIHQLVNNEGPQLLQWFEQWAQASPLRLHRGDKSQTD
jgi:hypothetical protein